LAVISPLDKSQNIRNNFFWKEKMSDLPQYLTVDQLISLAKAQGVTFGSAAPKVHLAYLAKLGLIPHAVKRKYNGQLIGHYPAETLETLQEIQQMKAEGISYADMRLFKKAPPIGRPATNQFPISNFQFPIIAYLLTFALGILFGFFLDQAGATFKNISLAQSKDPIYLMTIDNTPRNLYKLGTIELK
jgi:DNA-binding transcriptional MerR regulator